MNPPRRGTLTLGSGRAEPPETERQIEIGIFDALLPCRRFTVVHKVAELGAMSLTTEFLLRLVRTVDGISESDAAAFFGFDRRELSFVLDEAVEKKGYLERREGRLWLSPTGREAFKEGGESPQVYEVEQRTLSVAFDLLSLAPVDWESIDEIDRALPQLPVKAPERIASAAQHLPDRFRRFFPELRNRGPEGRFNNRQLYSIDDVKPGDRFSIVVRMSAKCSSQRPSAPEPDLGSWKSGYEIDDREEVVRAAAAYIENLSIPKSPEDQGAYCLLGHIAPEATKRFLHGDVVSPEKLYQAALARVGDLRSDRPTVLTLGSHFTDSNVLKLADAMNHAARLAKKREADAAGGMSHDVSRVLSEQAADAHEPERVARAPRGLIWLVPAVPGWGTTRALPNLLEQMGVIGSDEVDEEAPFSNVAASIGRLHYFVEGTFDRCVKVRATAGLSPRVEVLIVPGRIASVLVHAPVRSQYGVAVPLGITSFDPDVVARSENLLRDVLPADLEEDGRPEDAARRRTREFLGQFNSPAVVPNKH